VAVKAGASDATIRVSQPNKGTCRSFTLEVGAIDLKTEKLGNARCEHLELKGGAADLTVDLTGDWPEGSNQVDVSVGFGSVTLRLPEGVGVEADVERFLVNFDRSGLLRRGSNYYSANWDAAKTKIQLNLRAAMGDIQVEWVR
jgi:predicted membrane protein